MVTRIESFNGFNREDELEEAVRTMTPEKARKYLENQATMYLNMVDRYSSNKRLMQKAQ